MSGEEQVRAVGEFGYTQREARFLVIAVLFGYFLRRQFNAFVGRKCGAVGEAFIRRVLDKGHAAPHQVGTKTILYHLCGRALYTAAGDGENRNRREHAIVTVKQRVMALDFVLDTGVLPCSGQTRTELLRRCAFGELDDGDLRRIASQRWPLGDVAGVPQFVYIDEGASTFSGLKTFLEQNRRCLQAIRSVQIVYVGSNSHRFAHAEVTFRRFLAALSSNDGASERLFTHFQDRFLYEQGELSAFDQMKLDRLRTDQEQFSGSSYERRYIDWKKGQTSTAGASQRPSITFTTHLLKHDYSFLGSWER